MNTVDRELNKRILDELKTATNQPLRHNAETHPFWASLEIDKAPDRIVIATSSYRKVVLFTLQFLALNGEAMPPFFEEYGQHPLTFLRTLKEAFHNGNNESTGEFYVGELFGVPIYAQASEGEKHDAKYTQRDEARHKAAWVAKQNEKTDYGRNTWYVGVDTMDTIWANQDGRPIALERLPKPSSWKDFPQDWKTNPSGYNEYKRRVIEQRFPQGGTLQGVTAGAIVDSEQNERSIGFVSVEAKISKAKLLSVIDQFDHNASAFGVLQLLINWDQEGGLNENPQLMQEYFPHLSPEKQRIAAFFLLSQIMGAPAMLILELVASAHPGMLDQQKTEIEGQLGDPPALAAAV